MNGEIACIDLPELEVTLVALQSVGAESFGGLVLQKAGNRLGQREGALRSTFHRKILLGRQVPETMTAGLTKTA